MEVVDVEVGWVRGEVVRSVEVRGSVDVVKGSGDVPGGEVGPVLLLVSRGEC